MTEREYQRAYYVKHRQRRLAYAKRWNLEHQQECKAYKTSYERKKPGRTMAAQHKPKSRDRSWQWKVRKQFGPVTRAGADETDGASQDLSTCKQSGDGLMRRQTLSENYARRLIGNLDTQIEVLQRAAFHAEDEVRELREKEAALRLQVDGLCTRLDRMGAEMGAANCREIRVRMIAETALNALAAMASALPSSNVHHCVTTLLAVERDGRAQLAKHMDKPVALEAAR